MSKAELGGQPRHFILTDPSQSLHHLLLCMSSSYDSKEALLGAWMEQGPLLAAVPPAKSPSPVHEAHASVTSAAPS